MTTFLLAAFGLAYVVGHSTISLPFRTWLGGTPEKVEGVDVDTKGLKITPAKPGAMGPLGDFLCSLIECPACFGWWTGLIAGCCGFVSTAGLDISTFGWPLTLACVTSGSNYALGRLTRLI